jgi:hypothetical protein
MDDGSEAAQLVDAHAPRIAAQRRRVIASIVVKQALAVKAGVQAHDIVSAAQEASGQAITDIAVGSGDQDARPLASSGFARIGG